MRKTYAAKTLLVLSLSMVVMLTSFNMGCSSRFGPQTTTVNHYPDCYQPIADMRANEFMEEESTITGALVGALVGGLIGYAADRGRGAAIGATMGAVGGGIIGNQYARIARERDDLLRLQYYSEHLGGTVAGMDATTAAASVARQCYERQFEVAVAEFKSNYLNKEQFHSRYVEISSGLEETSRILGMTINSVNEVSIAYEEALALESQRLGVSPDVMSQLHAAGMEEAVATTREQGRTGGNRPAKPPQPASRPGTGLPRDVNDNLVTMTNSGAAVENSLNNARAEQDLINARLDLTDQIAADLLS